MHQIKRYLDIKLPERQSAFLWGPRKTGKSTYLKSHFKEAIYYDLLMADLYIELNSDPSRLRRQLQAQDRRPDSRLVIIDEVQKIPALLDEIHYLIENTNYHFILCGSNAAKLRRIGSNLLGGRAWRYGFFPFVYPELPKFDLIHIFRHGTIPSHYFSSDIKRSLDAYIHDYLTLEIQAEGLARNLPAFTNFLRVMSFSVAEMLNYTNIARECAIDAKTVQAYFQVLYDSMIGHYILPYHTKDSRKEVMTTPKFYIFDVGFMNKLKGITCESIAGSEAGKALENYIFCEINAYKELNNLNFTINYWRTKYGHEVDFVLDGKVGIEVKITSRPTKAHYKDLMLFAGQYGVSKLYLVCNLRKAEVITDGSYNIFILPIEEFLQKLWRNEILGI